MTASRRIWRHLTRAGTTIALLLGLSYTTVYATDAPAPTAIAFAVATAAVSLAAIARSVRGRFQPSLRLLLVVFVAGVAFQLLCLQPFDAERARTGTVAMTLALALCVLGQAWYRRAIPGRARRAIEITATNLCAIAFATEVTLRITAHVSPLPIFVRAGSDAHEVLDRFRYPPGYVRYGFPCNRAGYYDTEFVRNDPHDDTDVVVVIGDSFGAGVVPHYAHYTTQCERRLRGVEVYNMGVPCADMHEYLHLLCTEALPLRPDAIVLATFVGNDLVLMETDAPVHRTLFDREQMLSCLLPQRLVRLVRENSFLRPTGRAPGEHYREFATDNRVLTEPAEIAREFPWLLRPELEQPHMSAELFTSIERELSKLICDPKNGGRYAIALRVLEEMVGLCGDTPVGVMLIPDEFQVEENLWSDVAEFHANLELDRTLPQRLAIEHCDGIGVPYLDLLPAMLEVEPGADGRRHLYHLRDTHLNTNGNRLVGDLLAAFVASELGVSEVR